MKPDLGQSKQIETATLIDGDMRVSVLNYGAITQSWQYKDASLILGFEDPNGYLTDTRYFGAIVGRVANRIGGAKFDLADTRFELSANEGGNTLHGGADGLSKQFWDLEQIAQNEVLLSYVSRDGESGFPGEVRFELRICLQSPRLIYSIVAQPSMPTPISITQHNYYTLGASDGVDGHALELAANRYLEIDDQGIPTGRIHPTQGSELDLSAHKTIGHYSDGIDHFFCFDQDRDPKSAVARLKASSGLALTVYSDQPGAQVYSGYKSSQSPFCSKAVCIEPSGYPNAANIPSFPGVIYTPESPYQQVMILEISEDQHES